MILRLGGWLLFAAALALTSPARAQPRFAMESTTGPQPSTFLPGLTEILVRIDNPGPDKLVGEVELSNDAGRSRGSVSASFAVDAGSKALVRLPIMADQTLTGRVRVQGNVVHTESFSPHLENSVRVLDAHQPSRLRPALESLHLAVPGGPGGYSPGNFPRLRVAVAPRDDATGAAIFPVRPASWHDIHLVVAPSDALFAASAEELAALSGYVLAEARWRSTSAGRRICALRCWRRCSGGLHGSPPPRRS